MTSVTFSLRPAALPSAPEEGLAPPRPQGLYPLPAHTGETGDIWDDIRAGRRELDPHRAYLKSLVSAALAEGLFYTTDVHAHVTGILGDLLTEEMRARNNERVRVEGGVIGMEIYHARRLIDHERTRHQIQQAHARVQPQVGQALGTLIWHDHKRTTGCQITAIDGMTLTLTGRRGRAGVTTHVDARYIEEAQKRTREHAAANASRS